MLVEANLAGTDLSGASLAGVVLSGAKGLESVHVDWIEIGPEGVSERLEGELALRWLLNEAACPLPEGWEM